MNSRKSSIHLSKTPRNPKNKKTKRRQAKGRKKKGVEDGTQTFSSPAAGGPARRRGWASVLRTKWSRWRREGSEKVR